MTSYHNYANAFPRKEMEIRKCEFPHHLSFVPVIKSLTHTNTLPGHALKLFFYPHLPIEVLETLVLQL